MSPINIKTLSLIACRRNLLYFYDAKIRQFILVVDGIYYGIIWKPLGWHIYIDQECGRSNVDSLCKFQTESEACKYFYKEYFRKGNNNLSNRFFRNLLKWI